MKGYVLWIVAFFLSGWSNPASGQDKLGDSVSFTSYSKQATDTVRNHILANINAAKTIVFDNRDSAVKLYIQAIGDSRASGFREGLVKALNGLAVAEMYYGNHDNATHHLQAALHLAPGLPMPVISELYTALAGVHLYKNQYSHAVWFLYKYLELAETNLDHNPPLARTYNNLSAIWNILKDTEKQLKYTQLAEKAALRENDSFARAITLFRKGLFIQDTNVRLALTYHHQALDISRKTNDHHTIISALTNIALAHRLMGNRGAALQYLRMADSMVDQARENPFNKLSFYTALGEAYYLLGKHQRAEALALKAIRFAASLNTQSYLIKPYNLLTHIYEEGGQYEKAFASQKQFMRLRDSLTSEQTVQTAHLLELKYQTARQDRELAFQQLAISHHQTQILRKNIIIGSIIGGLMLLGIVAWTVYRNMKTKNRIQRESIRSLKREREIEQMKAIMQGEDQESIRIGQELHDGIGSMLSVIKMNLSMIPQEHQELAGSRQYQDILDLLDKTSTDLRETAHNLMLDSLLQGGLEEALQHFCEKNGAKYKVNIHFLSYGEPPRELPQDFRRAVYRIMRELIAHSIRQKNVTLVVVQFNWQDDILSIILEDDAPVVDNRKLHPLESSSGLISRIGALNGRVDIEYGEEKGITIDIEFDIRADEEKWQKT